MANRIRYIAQCAAAILWHNRISHYVWEGVLLLLFFLPRHKKGGEDVSPLGAVNQKKRRMLLGARKLLHIYSYVPFGDRYP